MHVKQTTYRFTAIAACLLSAITLTSCEDNDKYDHAPPAGQGSIVIDNNSGDDTAVYIDGGLVGIAESGEDTAFDFQPGRYRLVLAEVDGDRNYRDDVDILENRLTVLDISSDYAGASLYYVAVKFQ